MSEYIYGTDEQQGHWLTNEEIVRCRDCKHLVTNEDYCCYECGNEQWEGYAGLRCEVKPDGFCSWGDRKVS